MNAKRPVPTKHPQSLWAGLGYAILLLPHEN